MRKETYRFGESSTEYFFSAEMPQLKSIIKDRQAIVLTDENVLKAHPSRFRPYKMIVIRPGEINKVQATVDAVISQLIDMRAERSAVLIGVGGGVITDLTGFIASIYLRGISFGFVPTSLLAMVDASIGGKNGIDVGAYKNMVGMIRQPSFILYDTSFLKTLPRTEWRNGFAEIIKHAAVMDADMFAELEGKKISAYKPADPSLPLLIKRNARLKTKLVQKDQFEKGDRKLLNFGHTLGHAIENLEVLSHGEAISIGMSFAGKLSAKLEKFKGEDRLRSLLSRYGLPVEYPYNKSEVIRIMEYDKKREGDAIQFVLLKKIGKGIIRKISLKQLYGEL